ncbi:MAG TPA: DNA repair exonuclease [Clostridia bacterium]|nr:DNA repair exonuclease [Clostridia bacterium]
MRKVRFIHTADVHLGSLLHVGGEDLPSTIEQIVEEATLEGFRRICEIAVDKAVDFVVISGDLYDREARSVKAISFFVDRCLILEKANIDVVIIAGNHDPLREQPGLFNMPDNVKTLGGDAPEVYEVLDGEGKPLARIVGQSYESSSQRSKVHLEYRVPDKDIWNIALLHTQLESGSSNYIPSSLKELRERDDIHYWALGHLHEHRILNDSYPLIAYPGIPQGRDFGELGIGGCILVELSPFHGGNLSFIPTASVIYKRVSVFIDEDPGDIPETLSDLEDRICDYGDRILKELKDDNDYPITGYIVEWIICGRGIIHDLIKEQEVESVDLLIKALRRRYEDYNPFLWTNSIDIRTKSPINHDELMESSPVYMELEKVSQLLLEDEDTQDRLMGELGNIWSWDGDHEDVDEFRFHMDERTLEDMLDRAKQLIIEKLVEGRE